MGNYRLWRILFLAVLVVIMAVVVALRLNLLATVTLPDLNRPVSLPQPVIISQGNDAPPIIESPDDLNQITALINEQRSANGIALLWLDAALSEAARQSSEAAARQNSISPVVDIARLALDAGYRYSTIQQTMITTARLNTKDTFDAWWNTEDIRSVLLTMEFSDIGIGRTPAMSGDYYYAILLASPSVLTAPGADSRAVGDASPSGQSRVILDLLNAARQSNNLRPLSLNSALIAAAQRHSDDQAARDLMTHDGSDGTHAAERASAAGYNWRTIAENVLMRLDLHAAGAFDQWWNSPDHLANMLNPDFTQVGIAYARSATGLYYYTMVLAAPQ